MTIEASLSLRATRAMTCNLMMAFWSACERENRNIRILNRVSFWFSRINFFIWCRKNASLDEGSLVLIVPSAGSLSIGGSQIISLSQIDKSHSSTLEVSEHTRWVQIVWDRKYLTKEDEAALTNFPTLIWPLTLSIPFFTVYDDEFHQQYFEIVSEEFQTWTHVKLLSVKHWASSRKRVSKVSHSNQKFTSVSLVSYVLWEKLTNYSTFPFSNPTGS